MENNVKLGNLNIENARIIFRNFRGEASKFNNAGCRNFCVVLPDEDTAKNLAEDGWNIKKLMPREEDDEPAYYIPVSVSFENYPANIYLISGRNKTRLDEDSVKVLDYAEIKNVDLILRPYQWGVNGKSGVKAYLKTMYVTVEEDKFAAKYENLDDENLPF